MASLVPQVAQRALARSRVRGAEAQTATLKPFAEAAVAHALPILLGELPPDLQFAPDEDAPV